MITVTMMYLAFFLFDCPSDLESFGTRRATIDGLTSTTGSVERPHRHIMVGYVDNRESAENRFFSIGYATIGNPEGNEPVDIKYRMAVDLPDGNYHITNIKTDNQEQISICATEGELVFVIDDLEFTQGEYRSYEWEFEIYITILGDANGDRIVDNADLAYLLLNWGTNDPNADLNDDGAVDEEDMAILLEQWGEID